MITQTPEGKTVFQFYRPEAQQVMVAGDFNGWQPSFHMVLGRDGCWRCQVELAPGVYRFRYFADGQWFTDYAAFGVEPGPFGMNSVLRVEAVEAPAESADLLTAAEPAAVELRPPTRPPAPPQPRRPVREEPARQRLEQPAAPTRVRRQPALATRP